MHHSASGRSKEEASAKFAQQIEEKGGYHKPKPPKSVTEALGANLSHDNSAFSKAEMAKIEHIYGNQPALLAAIAKHGGSAHIYANKSVAEHPGMGYLAAADTPSSYAGSGISKMSGVNGVYSPSARSIGINGSANGGSAIGVGPHEFGHMVDHALGPGDQYFSDNSTGMEEAAKSLRQVEHDVDGNMTNPHYLQPGKSGRHEIFAETFPAYLKAKKSGADPKIAMTDGLGTYISSYAKYRRLKNSTAILFLEKTYDKLMKELNSER
jgi:hypothetical protein